MMNLSWRSLYKLLNSPRCYDLFLRCFADHPVIKKVIKSEINIDKNDKILDIGSGTGNFSGMFPNNSYIGVDTDSAYVNYSRTRHKKNFLVMDATSLGFKDSYFDTIFVNSLFHHLDDKKVLRACREIKRVLKPSGKALVVDVSFDKNKNSFLKRLMRNLDRGKDMREIKKLTELIMFHLVIKKQYSVKSFLNAKNYVFVLSKIKFNK